MGKSIKCLKSTSLLHPDWDSLAQHFFQKKAFLAHLHQYNPCQQRYYELYDEDKLVAGTIVYTLQVDILTFANIPSPFKMQIIGLPVSVASPPMIGEEAYFEYLLNQIISREKGLILGINFTEDYLKNKVINLRTLPTFTLRSDISNYQEYLNAIRHPYRRRLKRMEKNFENVRSETTSCTQFSPEHYQLYLEIMKRTTTKLETLSFESFQNLPDNFELNTFYNSHNMICWNITCKDEDTFFFYFGGMNYGLRDHYQAYNNSILAILKSGLQHNFNTIDFGQTAEVAKSRLGAIPEERRMFLFHHRKFFFWLINVFKGLISYDKICPQVHVFKQAVN